MSPRRRRSRPYIQATWKLNDNWNVVTGARMDVMHVETSDPLNPRRSASIEVGEPNAERQPCGQGDAHGSRPTSPTTTARTTRATWRTAAASASTPTRTATPRFRAPSSRSRASSSNWARSSQLDDDKLFISNDIFDQIPPEQAAGLPGHPVHRTTATSSRSTTSRTSSSSRRSAIRGSTEARRPPHIPVPGLRRQSAPRRPADPAR